MVINDDIWFLNESYAQDFYREARINNKGIKIYFGENKEELIPPGEYETE